jgi:hypothetical protein
LKKFDDQNVASGKAAATVASQFVQQQLHHMRNNESTDRAYDKAAAWLVDNGKRVLANADPALKKAGSAPTEALPPVELFERVMSQQSNLVDEVLKAAGKSGDDKFRGLPPYRDFRTGAQRAALAARAASKEPKYPSGYITADEADKPVAQAEPSLLDSEAGQAAVAKHVATPKTPEQLK